MNLADVWLLLIGFFLLYYAITDGADLGVGILSLFAESDQERQAMMAAIGSTWHANQTWLLILGGMLFGAFPVFYAVVLSALYVPFVFMLFGLIFRGVAFEFHTEARRKSVWLYSFAIGSLVASIAQGFALGGLLGGIRTADGRFAGSIWDWLSLPSALITVGLLCGYLMLGANTLIMKTEAALWKKSRRAAWLTSVATLFLSAAVHLQTAVMHPDTARKWIDFPRSPMTVLLLLTLAAFVFYFRSLFKGRRAMPYFWNGVIIVLSFTGLSVGLYPHMIPGVTSPAMTVQDVAASEKTLKFMLVVTAVTLPVILAYTSYSYWVFRGSTAGYGEQTMEGDRYDPRTDGL